MVMCPVATVRATTNRWTLRCFVAKHPICGAIGASTTVVIAKLLKSIFNIDQL